MKNLMSDLNCSIRHPYLSISLPLLLIFSPVLSPAYPLSHKSR